MYSCRLGRRRVILQLKEFLILVLYGVSVMHALIHSNSGGLGLLQPDSSLILNTELWIINHKLAFILLLDDILPYLLDYVVIYLNDSSQKPTIFTTLFLDRNVSIGRVCNGLHYVQCQLFSFQCPMPNIFKFTLGCGK